MRSVFTIFIARGDGLIARNPQIATAGRMGGSACFAGLFLDFNVFAVGAVGISHELYLMAYDRSPCILLPGQYRDALGQRLHPPLQELRGASLAVPRTHLPS